MWSKLEGGDVARSGSGVISLAADVDHVLQLLTRLKVRNLLGGYFDASTGFRIPANARLPLAGPETPETTDLDLIAAAKRAHDTVENRLYNDFRFFPGHLDNSRYLFNQIGLRHLPPFLILPNRTG